MLTVKHTGNMKAAIYARVSTDDQNCEMQLNDLRAYCQARGWEIHGEYVDTISGSKDSRPRRNVLMKVASARKVDAVVVWKLDRWGRSLTDVVSTVRSLNAGGVRFLATTQGIDTDDSNPTSRLLLNIFATFAEFERDVIRERVNAGVKRYQSEFIAGRAVSKSGRNLPIGRPKTIFRVDHVLELRRGGMSWRNISKELGIPEATLRARCAENLLAANHKTDRKQTESATA
jgi:DNA invertase Pin-like site-specific DNA recombinase